MGKTSAEGYEWGETYTEKTESKQGEWNIQMGVTLEKKLSDKLQKKKKSALPESRRCQERRKSRSHARGSDYFREVE